MEKYCTLNTDASVKDGVGGYAIWVTTDKGRIKRYGKFKNSVDDPNKVEMMAVINGMHVIIANKLEVDTLVVNTDNLFCRTVLNKKMIHTSNKELVKLSEQLLELCGKFRKVYAKHMKGHTKLPTARHHVNRWCDEYSKKGRLL